MDVGFRSSTHCKSWMFKDLEECHERRRRANRDFIEIFRETFPQEAMDMQFLTYEEEQMIVSYYFGKMKDYMKKFTPNGLPKTVQTTAMEYYKRFYLNNSAMKVSPKHIFPVAVFLATKVEEYYVSIEQCLKTLKVDEEGEKNARTVIKQNEFLLMNEVNFDLTVWQPFRAIEGFLIDIKTRFPLIKNADKYRKNIDNYLTMAMNTDATFIFQPNQLALLAVVNAANEHQDSIDGYFPLLFGEQSNKQIIFFKQAFDKMIELFRTENPDYDKATISSINKRLHKIVEYSQKMLLTDQPGDFDDEFD